MNERIWVFCKPISSSADVPQSCRSNPIHLQSQMLQEKADRWEWHQFCVTTRFLHALKKITKNDATVQMFGVGNVFFLNVSYAHQCCIHCILHFKTTVFYLFYLNILKNVAIFSCDLKSWIFSCHYSSFQCHMITFTFMHLADAFIQSDFQTILFFSVCVFPGNWTHNLLRC